jgi:hypothetical protein
MLFGLCTFNVLSYFIHNMLPVVWMGSPDYELRMRVLYVVRNVGVRFNV